MLKKMNAPKPAPEVAKLDYFVGHWAVEGTIFPGPWGGGGKFGWTEKSQWMPGNFFVVGHWDFTMPAELGGDGEELFVMVTTPTPASTPSTPSAVTDCIRSREETSTPTRGSGTAKAFRAASK
jgi:hypothetical protein